MKDVLAYCRYSANPVGRIVLYACGYRDPIRFGLSDQTCSALQLANFWQDVRSDYARGRIYIPLEDMNRFGADESMIAEGRESLDAAPHIAFIPAGVMFLTVLAFNLIGDTLRAITDPRRGPA